MVEELTFSKGVAMVRTDENAMPLREEAFESFYRRVSRPLSAYITRTLRDRTVAEDIFQRAFYQFLRSPLPTTDEGQMKAYLYKIASNLMIDHWRRSKVERESLVDRLFGRKPEAGPDLYVDVRNLFQTLKPQERALLWLAHVEGNEHREIAQILGLAEGSVKVLLFRARKRFEVILRHHELTFEALSS